MTPEDKKKDKTSSGSGSGSGWYPGKFIRGSQQTQQQQQQQQQSQGMPHPSSSSHSTSTSISSPDPSHTPHSISSSTPQSTQSHIQALDYSYQNQSQKSLSFSSPPSTQSPSLVCQRNSHSGASSSSFDHPQKTLNNSMIGESTPRVIKQALHHQFKPEWRGVIKKQGHRVKNWKNRYFVLSNCVMLYYRCEADYINPEKCHDPLGYHIITSISPVNDKVFAGAGGVSSSNSAVTSKMMSENYEYVVETLEEKTFYLKFSFTSGFFNAAQRAISVYLTEYREVAEPPLQLAICLSHIGYIDLSIQLLQNFVRRTDSKNVEGLYHLGTALLINNNFVDAINVLQECLDAKNDHTQAMINLATALYCTDSLDHARSLYESALRLEPSNVEAANNLTLLHAQNGTNSELELAEFKIKYAITCRNDEPQLYLTYAEVLMSVNDLDRAIDILFQGLKAVRTQDSSNLNLKLGELFFLKNQDKSEAIEYFQHAIGINPKNMKARQLLEEALIMREDAVTTQESQLLKHQHDQLKSQSTTLHAVDEHSNKQEFDSINSDIVILKGMLEKKNPEEGGEWRTQYCELSRQKLQWFLSGSEYAKMKDPNVAGGDTYSFRSTSEHDTNTWLDTLQIQRVYYERHMS